jgi:hypothetical protein
MKTYVKEKAWEAVQWTYLKHPSVMKSKEFLKDDSLLGYSDV